MNKRLTFAAVLMLLATTSAIAQFRTVNLAHEIKPRDLRLPASTTGNLAFKECDACELITLRVDANTRYLVDGEDVDLREIRLALRQARREPDVPPVIVLQNLETDFALSVKVEL